MPNSESDNATGTRIPDRPDFPVSWEDDVEPTLLWSWDEFHSPLPRTPMTASVGSSSRSGMTDATKATGAYRGGGKSKVVNGYPYSASTAGPLTEEEIAEKTKVIEPFIRSVRSNWDEKWLPELKDDLEWMKNVPFSELSAAELWETVERFLEKHSRHWFIHHMVVMPVIAQSNKLEKICGELLGETGKSVVPILLHGVETMTVRSIRELEKLAESARADEEVASALQAERTACETTTALEASEAGRRWLAELKSYLYEFGYRCAGFDLSFPTWVEDRSFAYQVIRNLLLGNEDGSAAYEARERELDAERDRLMDEVRAAGADKPDALQRFEEAFPLAQETWPLKENHSHYIDQASTALVRIVLAEVGRRLAADGAISDAGDVWYIDLDEAKAALLGDAAQDLKTLVAERRADRERFSKLTPPKYLGTYPPDHEIGEPASESLEPGGSLRGTAASAGEATGVARVVLSPEDFHKVRKGDVLVCRSTAPMWTPLFRVISGLVSEAGGILSHPAVVAREFKLPAVVGVPNATNLIADGQPVTVSGTDGIVHAG